MEKSEMFCCDFCDKIYKSKKAFLYHKNNFHNKKNKSNLNITNNTDNNQIVKSLTDCIGSYHTIVKDALQIAKVNSKTANTSMSILKYANLHLNDVEPLKELNSDDISKVIGYKNPKNNESKNESYVKTAIYKYNHHIFYSFIGDMIVEYYKPTSKNKANVIATDTSRLCFIIMQKITKGKKEQNEWINDKSGKKFTELVLTPVINAVKCTLVEFVEFKKKKELNENSLCLMAKCIELKRDIEVDKFTNQILKYVAPYFHFDNLKLLTNFDYVDNINDVDDVDDIDNIDNIGDIENIDNTENTNLKLKIKTKK